MYYGRKKTFELKTSVSSKTKGFFVSNFQRKYSAFILTAFLGCGLLFILPAAWYINSNFDLLSQLALDTSPVLLVHLEREIQWLNIYLFLTLAGLATSCLVLTRKLTYNLIEPAQSIERFLRSLQDGSYANESLEVSNDHDLKELAETAMLLQKKLYTDAINHKAHLDRLTTDVHSREALYSLQILKDYYTVRSEGRRPITAPALKLSESVTQRRVS